MNIGSFLVPEYMFVEVFQPGGWMSNWVVQALANVWNEKWSGVQVMLDVFPVVSINWISKHFSIL